MSDFATRLKNPRGTIFLNELLKEIGLITSKEERVAVLHAYVRRSNNYANLIQFFIETLYHPAVVMDLPAGAPKYRELDAKDETMAFSTLFKEILKIKYFVKGTQSYIADQKKREKVFIQILESLSPAEAKLLIMMKDKKLDKRVYPLIGEDTFREAFPSVFKTFPESKAPEASDEKNV